MTEVTSHNDDQIEAIEQEVDGLSGMIKSVIVPDLRDQGKQIQDVKERLQSCELESTGLKAKVRSQDEVIKTQDRVIQGLKLKEDAATAASRMPWTRDDESEHAHIHLCTTLTQQKKNPKWYTTLAASHTRLCLLRPDKHSTSTTSASEESSKRSPVTDKDWKHWRQR